MNTTTLNMTTLDGGNVIIKKGGGGTPTPPSGESTWRYFDCKQAPTDIRVDLVVELQSMIVKLESLSDNSIMSSAMMEYIEDSSAIVAFGADMSIVVKVTDELITLGQHYEMATDILTQSGIVEITKEQFYSLD